MAASDTSHERPTLAGRLTRTFAPARFTEAVRASRPWIAYWAAFDRFSRLPFNVAVAKYWHWYWRFVSRYMPKRLYARSLIIIITPMILLQSVVGLIAAVYLAFSVSAPDNTQFIKLLSAWVGSGQSSVASHS